jgi:hypothetical protein
MMISDAFIHAGWNAMKALRRATPTRYYWLLLAEGHLTRRVFGAVLQRVVALPVPAGR